MITKRKLQPPHFPARVERSPNDVLWCQWSSKTHAPYHKTAEPGVPFCLYHVAAAHGMARGASAPDQKTRDLFEQVWDFYDKEDHRA
jgi:hypothetical protein